jgi:uncharacterized protein DUF5994
LAHIFCHPLSHSGALRLALCERAGTRGGIDGAWWPKSSDLGSELPDLVAVFGSWIGAVARVVYDPSAWLSAPSRILSRNQMIAVDPYRLVFNDTVYMVGTHSRDAVLFVVPPSTASHAAERLLHLVSASAQPTNVSALRQLVREFETEH